MARLTSDVIKERAKQHGADIVGVAAAASAALNASTPARWASVR